MQSEWSDCCFDKIEKIKEKVIKYRRKQTKRLVKSICDPGNPCKETTIALVYYQEKTNKLLKQAQQLYDLMPYGAYNAYQELDEHIKDSDFDLSSYLERFKQLYEKEAKKRTLT